jgi:hypothetical protein
MGQGTGRGKRVGKKKGRGRKEGKRREEKERREEEVGGEWGQEEKGRRKEFTERRSRQLVDSRGNKEKKPFGDPFVKEVSGRVQFGQLNSAWNMEEARFPARHGRGRNCRKIEEDST